MIHDLCQQVGEAKGLVYLVMRYLQEVVVLCHCY